MCISGNEFGVITVKKNAVISCHFQRESIIYISIMETASVVLGISIWNIQSQNRYYIIGLPGIFIIQQLCWATVKEKLKDVVWKLWIPKNRMHLLKSLLLTIILPSLGVSSSHKQDYLLWYNHYTLSGINVTANSRSTYSFWYNHYMWCGENTTAKQ